MAFDISQLPELSWRGLTAPCDSAPIDFSLPQAERRWAYVSGSGHDHTGRDPLRMPVRLYFMETLSGGKKWFSEEWPKWWPTALLDGETGELHHPLLGTFSARVLSGHVAFVSQTRAGVVLDVTFTDTVEDPEVSTVFRTATVSPDAAAKAADQNAKAANIKYPDGLGEQDLFEAWDSIKGQVGSIGTQITGQINQLQGHVTSMIDDVESLNDVTKNPVTASLKTLWTSLEDTKKQAERLTERKVRERKVANDTTLDALAAETSNTLGEIMGLNLSLLNRPLVPAGSVVRFYAGTTLRSPLAI